MPNVVDVSSFGGVTREYQVAVDPNHPVGDQLIGVDATWYRASPAETRNIHHIRHRFELLLQHPVSSDFSSIRSYCGLVLFSV